MTTELTILNDQWKLFCAIFAGTFDMTKACSMANITRATVGKYKNDPLIRKEIASNIRNAIGQANVDSAVVKRHLSDMMLADVIDIYDEFGNFKQLNQWPKIWRQQIVSMELWANGTPSKVKFVDRMRIIELLGKHVDVNAFEEKHRHVHELSEGLAEQIAVARSRVARGVTVNQEGEEV